MKKVLITPLDWGLGHATRCIPIIRELLARECRVFVAGSGSSLLLLKNEFPHLTFFTLPAYRPEYSRRQSMIWKLAIQIPKFADTIKKEHREIETLIEKHEIDCVISDNRFGCWSSKIPSVFITHQLNILMPKGVKWIRPLIGFINRRLIRKFSICWIPDYADKMRNFSGALSDYDSTLTKVTYIGPLSRFHHRIDNGEPKYDVLCIISGPEPQRNIFEEKMREQLRKSGLRYFLIRGLYSSTRPSLENEVEFLNSDGLQTVISQSSLVIARSGYSTIMDLAVLGKRGILVPTPGQTEQEYLAGRWKQQGAFYSAPQHLFDLNAALQESKSYRGCTIDSGPAREMLGIALDKLLNGEIKINKSPSDR